VEHVLATMNDLQTKTEVAAAGPQNAARFIVAGAKSTAQIASSISNTVKLAAETINNASDEKGKIAAVNAATETAGIAAKAGASLRARCDTFEGHVYCE
jgi:hypothetical protein